MGIDDYKGGSKSRDILCLSPYTIHKSEKLVACDRQHRLKIHRNIISLFSVINSSKNVDHNSGGLHQSVNGRYLMSESINLS
jgi:hypothetical protein